MYSVLIATLTAINLQP